jgi:SAM-dependent methyltransferase
MQANAATAADPVPSYVLGHSDAELHRLARQGEFFRDLTKDVLCRAGLAPGMHVLDVGCGAGGVSLLAAEMVGPTGSVLGIDCAPAAIDAAAQRARARELRSVRFAVATLDTFCPDSAFDALIGRFVLTYQPDPVKTLRWLSRHVRPGGIVAFQEMAIPTLRSVPEMPLLNLCCHWILETFTRVGMEPDMGGKLYAAFLQAGLPPPGMIGACRVEAGPASPAYEICTEVLRSLLPAAERTGITTAAAVNIDTLASRLRAEAIERRATFIFPLLTGAWTRTTN